MTKGRACSLGVVFMLLSIGAAWVLPPMWTWLAVALFLVLFLVVLGYAICGNPFAVLITEENVISLSRFQTVLWTLIIVSAYFTIGLLRIKNHAAPPLAIHMSKELLALLGISATALVGSPLISATKKSKTPNDKAICDTATALIKTDNLPDSVAKEVKGTDATKAAGSEPTTAQVDRARDVVNEHNEGLLYKNPTMNDASFMDMFEGNEVGNAAHVDLAKVQMFYFTVIVALVYSVSLLQAFHQGAVLAPDYTFPALSREMVWLLGISNGGYLANKGVDHTGTT